MCGVRSSAVGIGALSAVVVAVVVGAALAVLLVRRRRARSPRNLRTACLLSKPSRRKVEVKVEAGQNQVLLLVGGGHQGA